MTIIAHRANLNGPSNLENQPRMIREAISLGYDVEIDVRFIGGHLWLGHDSAQYLMSEDFIYEIMPYAWFHCKNLDAMEYLLSIGANCFWHESDTYTLTSKGYIWGYPGTPLNRISVCVLPELDDSSVNDTEYICTDYPQRYKKQAIN
jgi:hypothetical protein